MLPTLRRVALEHDDTSGGGDSGVAGPVFSKEQSCSRDSSAACFAPRAVTSVVASIPDPDAIIFRRGDADSSGVVDQTDAIYINNHLFLGGPEPPCMNQADANGDGQVAVSDSMYLLNWLYSGGSAPPYPGPYNSVCTTEDPPYPGCQVNPCP